MSNNKITSLTLYVYHNIESQKWGFVLTLQYVYETSIPLVMQLNCAHPILQNLIKLLRRLFYEMFCSRYWYKDVFKYVRKIRILDATNKTNYSLWQNNSCVISEAFEYNNVFLKTLSG